MGLWIYSYLFCGLAGNCGNFFVNITGIVTFFLSPLLIIYLVERRGSRAGYLILIHLFIDTYYFSGIDNFQLGGMVVVLGWVIPASHLYILIKTMKSDLPDRLKFLNLVGIIILTLLIFTGLSLAIKYITTAHQPEDCDKLFGESEGLLYSNRENCYYHLAIINKKIEYCKKIADHKDTNLTLEDINIYWKAMDQDRMDACYYQFAVATKNESVCSLIVSKENLMKEDCATEVTGVPQDTTLESCINIKNTLKKDNCFFRIAERIKSPDICMNIERADIQDYCLGNFATTLEICQRITSSAQKQGCIKRVTGIALNPSTFN